MSKINYEELLENLTSEDLNELVNECNSWNGSFEYIRVYDFDEEFFNTFYYNEPERAASAVFFGNIQSWNDDYVRFDGYGNLESLSHWDYEQELESYKEEIVERALDLYQSNRIWVNSAVEELFESYLNDEEDEEEDEE